MRFKWLPNTTHYTDDYRGKMGPHTIGAYPLIDYTERYAFSGDMGTGKWRLFWSQRKRWKVVRPAWLDYVIGHAGHSLDYPGKVEWYPAWKVTVRLFWERSLYANNNINDSLNFQSPEVRGRIYAYDYDFFSQRKPWKVMSKQHIGLVMRNLGGDIG